MYPFHKRPRLPHGAFLMREQSNRHAAALSSLSTPRATTFNPSSGNGRCKAFASSHGARIQASRSSAVVKITGIALGWIDRRGKIDILDVEGLREVPTSAMNG